MSNSEIAVKEFADIVRRFCVWAENLTDPKDEDLEDAQRFLCKLHLSVLRLPVLDSGNTEDCLTRDDWLRVHKSFQQLPLDWYWKVFDVFSGDEVPVFCSISDDLADIYKDLKEGLLLYDSGKVNEAVWEWRFNYLIHWGRHLTGAQTALHQHLAANLV